MWNISGEFLVERASAQNVHVPQKSSTLVRFDIFTQQKYDRLNLGSWLHCGQLIDLAVC